MSERIIFKKILTSLIVVLSMALIGSSCGGGSSGGGGGGAGGGGVGGGGVVLADTLVIVSEGTTMSLAGVTVAGDVVNLDGDSAALPPTVLGGFLPEHTIFSITKHPTENWLYVTSMNDCNGNDACWGNARIDRFSFTASSITHEDIVFEYLFGTGPACADVDWAIVGQTGACAPTATAFSSDGLRLYVNEDHLDGVNIFGVDAVTGFLTFLSEGASTFLQGIAVSPDDSHLYNGGHVIEVTGDVATDLLPGTKGNATTVVTNVLGDNLLTTTESNTTLAVYDLVDQAAPALIDSIAIANQQACVLCGAARFQDAMDDLSRFIVVGANSIATVSFDGVTFALEDQLFDTNPLHVINRGVQITPNGQFAVVAWFIPRDAAGNRLMTGGLTIYGIDAVGTLSELGSADLLVPSRAVLVMPLPLP